MLAILGVDFALLCGALAFILNYIPNLGSIAVAIPATLIALVQLGPGYLVATVITFVVLNVMLGNLVEPWLMGRRFGLSDVGGLPLAHLLGLGLGSDRDAFVGTPNNELSRSGWRTPRICAGSRP